MGFTDEPINLNKNEEIGSMLSTRFTKKLGREDFGKSIGTKRVVVPSHSE